VSKQDFTKYQSPFSWRYGSDEMRKLFSEQYKIEIWRRIWVSLAEAEHEAGLVSSKELKDLKSYQSDIDLTRIAEIEKETKHDVVAAIKEYAEKAKNGGGKIHLGATSMDIVDNTDFLRIKEALTLTEEKIKKLLGLFAEKIDKYAEVVCLGYTHLQPAEPTTVGYRFAFYAQDLLTDLETLRFVQSTIKAKGLKGAVGTAASYKALFDSSSSEASPNQEESSRHARTINSAEELEKSVMERLGIDAVLISTQVAPRKFDFLVLSLLASIASSIAKFAGDLRILQSPMYGEWSEPFGTSQVGSSAMPFKKNPVNAEKICSLARFVTQLPPVALENATHSYLERTLDDSANKRIIIAEGFLSVDEILETAEKIISGLVINEKKIKSNLSQFAPFAASESIMMYAVTKGANRQKMHELLREIAMTAWDDVQNGQENPMRRLLSENKDIARYVSKNELKKLLDVSHHIGSAPERAIKLVKQIKSKIQ